MELTPAHLRYLLAIYEVSQTHLDISSRSIAEKLGVTKPSVVRVLNLLMERGMIVKEYYGKIYLTDRGIFVAREVKKQLDEVLSDRVHTLRVLLPYDKLGLAAPMRERGSVQLEEYREDGLYLEGIVKTEDLHCFEGYLV